MTSIVHDGNLTQAEALEALRLAAQSATEALSTVLDKCETGAQKNKVVGDRDTIVLAYLSSLKKSLVHTGPLFEKMASDLETESDAVSKKATDLKNATEAINLFAGLLQLAATLALAFG